MNVFVNETLSFLQEKLPSNLMYHSVDHTHKVLQDAVAFALADELSIRSVELIAVAAVFHDAGYIKQYRENEPIGAQLAREAMQKRGHFSSKEIQTVEDMILSTAFVKGSGVPTRMPLNSDSIYIMDADLASFGRDDFFENLEKLINEGEMNSPEKRKRFYQFTLDIMNNHIFYSTAAKNLLSEKKKQNTRSLISVLKEGEEIV